MAGTSIRRLMPRWKLERARTMRANPTPAEAILWPELMRFKAEGKPKFCRQIRIMGYIADFCARRVKLVIEIDGSSHNGREAYDRHRDKVLASAGFRTLRFTNRDVIERLPQTLARIEAAISAT